MTNEATERMSELICAELDKMWEVSKDDGGYYCYELYADYRDEMENKTATEILQSDDPAMALWDKVQDWWFGCECECLNELERDVENKLTADDGPYSDGFTPEESQTFTELMRELVYSRLPEEHYLNQKFYVNIMVDTGDGNYDYVLNSVYPCWYGRYEDRLDDKAGIVWLARQQGYTKTQLWKALREGDIKDPHGFLETMRQEVANCASHMMTLTFLVEMSLSDLIELNRLIKLQDRNGHFYDATKNPDCGYIIIDKKTMTGLYDPWGGGGSVLEIELDKDVRLPIRFIRSALPDGGDGWSIGSVYGMCGSAWTQGEVKQIHCPKKLKEGVA